MDLPFTRVALERLELADGAPGLGPSGRSLAAVRALARRLDKERDVVRHPERGVRAGHLFALLQLHSYSGRLLDRLRRSAGSGVLARALGWLRDRFGAERLSAAFRRLRDLYPLEGLSEELAQADADEAALAAMVRLWLINRNPAFARLRDLFDDAELDADTGYGEMVASLEEWSDALPLEEGGGAFAEWVAPLREAPNSVDQQLALVLEDEGRQPPPARRELLLARDVLREEEKPVFVGPGGPPPPPPPAIDAADLAVGEKRFSADRSWMPELVLAAKNALVWLDQLSRDHGRPIATLDAVPDAELDRLALRGVTGLWLIGLWERSPASAEIKRRCGNPEAAPSAYAIGAYRIAEELGGDEALDDLRRRAVERGLRLACDMVPNHFGVDSEWVLEHPERFLSVPVCPFPNYTFAGPDLSPDPAVGIYLEDGYWDRSDAAVVFRRVDRSVSPPAEAFVYHGNDGTSLPWNDTAQLDYLNPEVQEAVIKEILAVARRFPVIRFDAAMTLAKRHVQRLWYPQPGEGGDIPSRAEHALPAEEFARRMPEEFWRRVVDRIAEEVPDTLLLAEAFWLMESYFVRTLGMHRVYNSAFMHMLRDESNDQLQRSLAEVLAFEPEILKRFLNFLTNPDEKTALEQFGQGDKYFAACVLLVTLPGLPMFGHGQWEGLGEKYGMEYRRAYRDEAPDRGLVAHHERMIAPLLRRRALFAEVATFRLFPFEAAGGEVNADVYAFSNRRGDERALVLVHNRAAMTAGSIRLSVPFADRDRDQGQGQSKGRSGGLTRSESLGEALGFEPRDDVFWIFRDAVAGGERILSGRILCERGLVAELGPYEHRVYLDFRSVEDPGGAWASLAEALHGHAVADMDVAFRERLVQPVRAPVGELLSSPALLRLWRESNPEPAIEAFVTRSEAVFREVAPHLAAGVGGLADSASAIPVVSEDALAEVVAGLRETLADLSRLPRATGPLTFGLWGSEDLETRRGELMAVACRVVLAALAEVGTGTEAPRDLVDQWLLLPEIRRAVAVGAEEEESDARAQAVRLFTDSSFANWWRAKVESGAGELFERWLVDPEVRRFLGVHRFDDTVWFHREAFATFVRWLALTAALAEAGDEPEMNPSRAADLLQDLSTASAASGYRLDSLRRLLGGEASVRFDDEAATDDLSEEEE
ncbi:MAG: alpha-amylase family glycosyl hydrolase [Acidobacteriota bacterium]